MKFKIEKGTKLFQSFENLVVKADLVQDAANNLVKELTGKEDAKYMPDTSTFELYGGIRGIVFDQKPLDNKWRLLKCNHKNVYVPNKKTKEGKELQEKFNALPQVKTEELNKMINLTQSNGGCFWGHPGFDVKDNVVILDMPDGVTYDWYKPHPDMVEITEKEYFELIK